MADSQFNPLGTVTAPADWTLPPSLNLALKNVYASFDGSGASGNFVPCLEIVSDSGHTVGTYPCQRTVAAGASADVTWFPSIGASDGIRFDTYPQAGQWLYVEADGETTFTNREGWLVTASIALLSYGHDGGLYLANIGDAGASSSLDIECLPADSTDATTFDINALAAYDFNVAAGHDINLRTGARPDWPGLGSNINLRAAEEVNIKADGDQANIGTTSTVLTCDESAGIYLAAGLSQLFVLDRLPSADPGVSNALWNDGGTVKVSP